MPVAIMDAPQARPVTPRSPATSALPPSSPLAEEDYQALRQARILCEPIRVAARRARMSAISILLMGAFSLPFMILSPSLMDLYIVTGLGLVGVCEYLGAQRMKQGDPRSATYLARNQLIFLAIICVYCVLQMLSFSADQAISPELKSQLSAVPGLQKDITQMTEKLIPTLTYGIYATIIVASFFFQGGLAYYYYTRKPQLEAVQKATPAWVQRLFGELGI